jgi:hypothetical protein
MLIKANQGLDAAVALASKSYHGSHIDRWTYELFGMLVDQGVGYQEAVALARHAMHIQQQTEEQFRKTHALRLFVKLVEKGQGIDDAQQAVVIGQNTEDSDVKRETLLLMQKLVEAGHAPNDIFEAARKNLSSVRVFDRTEALDTLCTLVQRGQDIPRIIPLAKNALEGQYGNSLLVIQKILKLFRVLVESGNVYDLAIQVAEKGMDLSRNDALDLFGALVDKDQAYEQARKALHIGLEDESNLVKAAALKLQGKLRLKGIE